MRLLVEGTKEKDTKVTFRLVQNGEEILVEDVEKEWSLLSFRSIDGQVYLVRHSCIANDNRFALTDDGKIKVTGE